MKISRAENNIGLWFDENYIEESERIFQILEQACLKHACSMQSLFKTCRVIKRFSLRKTALKREIQYLVLMADHGISGKKAAILWLSIFQNRN